MQSYKHEGGTGDGNTVAPSGEDYEEEGDDHKAFQ